MPCGNTKKAVRYRQLFLDIAYFSELAAFREAARITGEATILINQTF